MGADRLDRLKYGRDDDDHESEGRGGESSAFAAVELGATQIRPPMVLFPRHRDGLGQSKRDRGRRRQAHQFTGQIMVEDFGCYARPFHTRLIREAWVITGLHVLSELDDKLRQ
jgi:hypothetical protein